ncbi:MAG: AlpA family phage regulatory protein [Mesorhizobium sp.]|nr:MAG: AlpA family phage regulatory protein [Mesorhizobium sp.]RWD58839.1 MAG: AlpA family phage regulatory protein [Mesorhizobium sp.]TIT39530.1 MAG: AlpA family phage regulatory protein [Mesorhizobium sp.]TIT73000.1 MAG: AlpA family phage regulatory protein [Mesorhizobium sp.]TIW24045.1 MAG: AlpA family phage regulatory protein [Mesorhizobium sp.]
MQPANDNRLIGVREVMKRTSLSLTFIKRLRKANAFPRAVPLGDRRIGFLEREINDWLDGKVAARAA